MTDDASDPGDDTTAESGTAVRRDRFSGGPARGFLSSMSEDDRIFEADLWVNDDHKWDATGTSLR